MHKDNLILSEYSDPIFLNQKTIIVYIQCITCTLPLKNWNTCLMGFLNTVYPLSIEEPCHMRLRNRRSALNLWSSIIKINKVKFDLSIGTISLCEYTCIFSLYFLSICSPTRFYVEHSRQQLYMLKCVHTTQISKIILYNKIAYSKNWENSQNILFYRNSG